MATERDRLREIELSLARLEGERTGGDRRREWTWRLVTAGCSIGTLALALSGRL